MKIGPRKMNLEKSIKARTTFSTNPLSYLGRSRKKSKKSESSNSRWLLFIILIILAYYVLK